MAMGDAATVLLELPATAGPLAGTVDEVLHGSVSWCVVHGDALHVLRDLPDGCVDAFVTDPPYSSGGAFRGDRVKDTTADVAGSDYAARAAGQRALFGEG